MGMGMGTRLYPLPSGDGDGTKIWYPLGLGMGMGINFFYGNKYEIVKSVPALCPVAIPIHDICEGNKENGIPASKLEVGLPQTESFNKNSLKAICAPDWKLIRIIMTFLTLSQHRWQPNQLARGALFQLLRKL